MSRKHWSDLFLFAAAASLMLAVVQRNYGGSLSIFAVPRSLAAGAMAHRRMR